MVRMKTLYTIYIDEEQRLLVAEEAKRRGITKAEIYRRALRQYLPKRAKIDLTYYGVPIILDEDENEAQEVQADG